MPKESSMNSMGIAGVGFQSIRDNGYQLVCLQCGGRHGCIDRLIGRERFLQMADCEPCKTKGNNIPKDLYGFPKERKHVKTEEEEDGPS